MKNNPEFFKAFPHLQDSIYRVANPEAKEPQYIDNLKSTDFFEPEDLKSDRSHNSHYFDSLMHQHTRYMDLETEKEEMIRENEINYVQGL